MKCTLLFPKAAMAISKNKVAYLDILSSNFDPAMTQAIRHKVPDIRDSIPEIQEFINSQTFLSDTKKTFYKTILQARLDFILDQPTKPAVQEHTTRLPMNDFRMIFRARKQILKESTTYSVWMLRSSIIYKHHLSFYTFTCQHRWRYFFHDLQPGAEHPTRQGQIRPARQQGQIHLLKRQELLRPETTALYISGSF